MTLGFRAAAILATTFALGAASGAVGTGYLAHHRERDDRGSPHGAGFVAEMEQLIQPRDSAQRDALRPQLEVTDIQNRQIVDGARMAMRVSIDSMRARVAPLLDAQQIARLDEFVQRPQRGDGPPGLGGPDGRGRGEPGRGPPPGRDGMPPRGGLPPGPPPRGGPPHGG